MENFQSMDTAEKLRSFLQRAQNIKESYTSDSKDLTRDVDNYANEIQDLSTGTRNYIHDPRENNATKQSITRPSYVDTNENQYQNPFQGSGVSNVPMGMKLKVQQHKGDQPKETETVKEQSKKAWHCKNTAIEAGVYGNFEIVTGGGGFRKLKYDGMLYSVNRITADQNKIYWRCANRKCNGRVTTQRYEIVGATDHSREAHSGDGGGYSAKTIKQLQSNLPSRQTSPRETISEITNKSSAHGKILSPAPASGQMTQPNTHAPNPYSPLMPHHLPARQNPTPPRNIHRHFDEQDKRKKQTESRPKEKRSRSTNASVSHNLPIHEAFPFSGLYRADGGSFPREGTTDFRGAVPSPGLPEMMPEDLRSNKARWNRNEELCE